MARKSKAIGGIKAETKTSITGKPATSVAAAMGASIGRTRRGRDSVTRVSAPIKVTDTQSRQWNRYSP